MCEMLSRSNLAVRSYGPGHGFWVCVHCDLDRHMTLSQGNDTPLGHGQYVYEIVSRYNLAVRSYGPDTDDLKEMTLGQGHDTLLGHRQLLREILSRSNTAGISNGPDKDFGYNCAL